MDTEELREMLRAKLRENREAHPAWYIRFVLNDPIQEAQDGRFHLNPIWGQLLILAGLGLATFLYFTFLK